MYLRASVLQRVFLLSVACGLFATMPLPAQTSIHSEVENQLREAEQQWQSASSENNIPAMLRIVAQNFVFVNPAGEVRGWEQCLTSVRKLTPEALEQRKTNITARDLQTFQFLGDTAILSYRLTELSGLQTLQTDVWVRMGSFWRLVHEQISNVELPWAAQ